MTRAAAPSSVEEGIRRLFDPATVGALLRDALSGALRRSRAVERVRVERCWPGRRGEFVFEWSFTLGRTRRCAVFGLIPAPPPVVDAQSRRAAAITGGSLCGVSCYFPQWKLLVHTPDCDPSMPHLAECLNAKRMAAHLRPLWGRSRGRAGSSATGIACQALAYRSGKRAVIAYRRLGSRRLSDRFLGKAFRDGRGERLVDIHRRVGEQLTVDSRGRVRVPVANGYLPDLRMTLFSWVGGRRTTGQTIAPDGRAFAAVDVLAALHRTALVGVSAFSVADECGIVDHWHAALKRVDPALAAATSSLRDTLLRTAERVEPTPQSVIHRDFYDRQLIVGRRTITLLDLDTLAQGSPAVDLGNLLAHVYLAALEDGRSQHEYKLFATELVSRYERQMGPLDRRALRYFWATALFRVGAVHALRTATRRHAPAMWACARRVLRPLTGRMSIKGRRPMPRSGADAGGSGGGRTARTLRHRTERLATRRLA